MFGCLGQLGQLGTLGSPNANQRKSGAYGATWDQNADYYTLLGVGPIVPENTGYGATWDQNADSYTTLN